MSKNIAAAAKILKDLHEQKLIEGRAAGKTTMLAFTVLDL